MTPSKVTAHENDFLEFECGHKPGCKHKITQNGDGDPVIEDFYGIPTPGDDPGAGGTPGGDHPGAPGSGSEAPGRGEEEAGTEVPISDQGAEEKARTEGKAKGLFSSLLGYDVPD